VTDGRTELRWLRRAIAVPAVARKNAVALAIVVMPRPSWYALIHSASGQGHTEPNALVLRVITTNSRQSLSTLGAFYTCA